MNAYDFLMRPVWQMPPVWQTAQPVINERQWHADLRNAAAFLIELGLDDRAIAQALDTTPKSIAILRNSP